jgi:hypothetical protein
MTKPVIAVEWNSYSDLVLPEKCGLVQYQETRRAFYAGAMTAIYALDAIAKANLPHKVEEQWMTSLRQEIETFLKEHGLEAGQ